MQQPSNLIPKAAPYPALPDGAPGALPPLEPEAAKSFPLHPFAQRSLYLYSMVNFAPLIEPVLECLKPVHIAEVGSERGNNTLFLYRWCKSHNARLTLVDTHPNVDPEMAADSSVSVFKGMSVEFLKQDRGLDVVFLDGDHNYETVKLELEGLEFQQKATGRPLMVFMHDVAWPCDRRDMYYDPATVEDKRPFSHEGGVEPFHAGLTDKGPGGSGRFAIANTSGGPRNGVLTAVEDFLASRKNSGWRFHLTPVVHGLGILWWDPALTDAQRAVVREVTEHLTRMKPFLAVLELNRIALGVALNAAGLEWQRNVSYIRELEARITAADDDLRRQAAELMQAHAGGRAAEHLAYIERLQEQIVRDTAGFKEYIAELESKLADSAQADARDQAYIAELEARLATQAGAQARDQAYIRELEARVASASAAHSEAVTYIRDLEARLATSASAHDQAQAYIRSMEAAAAEQARAITSARADHANAQAFAEQQSRALEEAVVYIRKLEARQAHVDAAIVDLEARLATLGSSHATLQANHAAVRSELAAVREESARLEYERARLASILALPATRLFWGKVRGTLTHANGDAHASATSKGGTL